MTVRVSATGAGARAAAGARAGGERDRAAGGRDRRAARSCRCPSRRSLIPAGWRGTVLPDGAIDVPARTRDRAGWSRMSVDPVELQVILGALRATCEEMGAVLIRSAHSANIKERRDASTALFDAAGEMVMQAEHIPVHLGAMPAAVAAVRDEAHAPGPRVGPQRPLPRAARTCPTSPSSRRSSRTRRAARLRRLPRPPRRRRRPDARLDAGRQPHARRRGRRDRAAAARRRGDRAARRADAPAATSAAPTCARSSPRTAPARGGCEQLAERVGARDAARRDGRGARLRRAAHARVHRRAARRRPHARATCWRRADGRPRAARSTATVAGERLVLDFAGSAAQHDGNLNCPLAVTRSACYFAVRVLTDPDIPPSAGAYRPIEVRAPEGSLLNARAAGRASSRGNVETSSRVADLVLAAFGRALGQGTMNNLTLGDERFTYYETLGGGQGACPDADGPSGVHVAMSNTLNTPVEALELEFPLRVTRVRAAARLGRRRPPPRRRRRRARAGGARADDVLAADRAAAPRAARRRRRRARRARAQPARRRASCRRRRAARWSPGSACGSRRPEAAGKASARRVARIAAK